MNEVNRYARMEKHLATMEFGNDVIVIKNNSPICRKLEITLSNVAPGKEANTAFRLKKTLKRIYGQRAFDYKYNAENNELKFFYSQSIKNYPILKI